MQSAGDLRGFVGRDDEGRGEEDVIAVDTVNAALRGVGEHVLVQSGLADALGYVVFSWERLARGFIFHEFDAEEKAETANFAHVRMRFQHGYFLAKTICRGRDAIEEILRLDVI